MWLVAGYKVTFGDFWHRSICRILKIGIMQVIEERISNKRVRKIFFNVPPAEKWGNYIVKDITENDVETCS